LLSKCLYATSSSASFPSSIRSCISKRL
jgi:hypothetical protein